MNSPESLFEEIGTRFGETHGASLGQMFGKRCIKVNGKAFASFFQDAMVFKLSGERHAEALNLPGSVLFDPSGKGRPMKEWVQVSFEHASRWPEFAEVALQYVENS
ncbi:MAG: hypothetical protein WCC10_14425 [Tumebacillaceae bacterium]